MTKTIQRYPELEEAVVTALAEHLNQNDRLFSNLSKGDRNIAKSIIRATSTEDENPERVRIRVSTAPIYIGYSHDIKDFLGKTKYELALIQAKREHGSERFVSSGVSEDEKRAWYITKIE